MTFLISTIAPLFLSSLVAGGFSYDGTDGPSQWGNEYKTCLGKFQSPIDIVEKDVTTTTFPPLQFSGVQRFHKAYMTNNGHTVMIQSFDENLPTVSGGPLNSTYVFQQLHFHWGQNDNMGSEHLINNRSFSMELHAVFWKKEYGSLDKAVNHLDGLTVLAYLYQVTDNPNPTFELIVPQIPEVTGAGSNMTIKDDSALSKLLASNIETAQDYFTYKGSLTTPMCLEIVQWIIVQPQFISHEQLAAFRSIQSDDGTNLTHNFRPVQPLDGRVVYHNVVVGTAGTSGSTNAATNPETPTTPPTTITTQKQPETMTLPITVAPLNNQSKSFHSGQQGMRTASPFAVILGVIFLLPYQ